MPWLALRTAARGCCGVLRHDLPQAVRALLTDRGDGNVIKRIAGTAFLIRVASAAILYLLQLFLARQMGRFAVRRLCLRVDLGRLSGDARAARAFQFRPAPHPAISRAWRPARLRGFLVGSRWLCFALGTVCGAVVAAVVVVFGDGSRRTTSCRS